MLRKRIPKRVLAGDMNQKGIKKEPKAEVLRIPVILGKFAVLQVLSRALNGSNGR